MMMAKMKMIDIVTISFKLYKDSGAAEPLGEPGVLWGKQQAGHTGGEAGQAEGAPEPVLNGFKELVSEQEYLCVLTQHQRIKEQRFPGFWFDNPMRDKSLLSEIKHQRGQVRSKAETVSV